uniref:Large ribosomal subunit protein uL23c n=1 Tax=Rhizochromulina marina TaxID=1034831 RepID=A0A514CPU8_9STRA|nr:ribosomal protein L23 [Rhizochromulina marina]QDH81839.1 ribosomal protein L23 [Rhizochromulina marina]
MLESKIDNLTTNDLGVENSLRQVIKLIKYPVISDKATRLLEKNKYTFLVDRRANKTLVKTAIEYIFDVKVKKINSLNLPKQKRTVGRFIGYKPQYKKVIVTLAEGTNINLFPDI